MVRSVRIKQKERAFIITVYTHARRPVLKDLLYTMVSVFLRNAIRMTQSYQMYIKLVLHAMEMGNVFLKIWQRSATPLKLTICAVAFLFTGENSVIIVTLKMQLN